MQTLMFFYLGGGLLLAALSLLFIKRKIKSVDRNFFHSENQLADSGKWYQANEYVGRRLFIAGIGSIVAALALYLWPGIDLTVEEYALSVTGVIAGLLLWSILQSYLYIKSLMQ